MAKRKKKVCNIQEPKYRVGTLSKSDEFSQHRDIVLALFDSQDLITKSDLRNAIKAHLEREV